MKEIASQIETAIQLARFGETTETPVEVTKDADSFVSSFDHAGRRYTFGAERLYPRQDHWDVSFERDDGDEMGGETKLTKDTGHAAVGVLRTVSHLMKRFLHEVRPRSVGFSAQEEERRPLYDKLATQWATDHGYRVTLSDDLDGVRNYTLKRRKR